MPHSFPTLCLLYCFTFSLILPHTLQLHRISCHFPQAHDVIGLVSKWGSMGYAFSSPGIVVVENGRSCRGNVGGGLISWARTKPLSAIIVVTIRWNFRAIHHHTVEIMLFPNLFWGWWLIWFWPTIECIPAVLHSQCKREVWVAPLHGPKLTPWQNGKDTLDNFSFIKKIKKRKKKIIKPTQR